MAYRPEIINYQDDSSHKLETNHVISHDLRSFLGMTVIHCAQNLTDHQSSLSATNDIPTFSNYFDILRSINISTSKKTDEDRYLISRAGFDHTRNIYESEFVSKMDKEQQKSPFTPIRICRLVLGATEGDNGTIFDIKYSLLVTEPSIHMYQQLASLDITLNNNGNSTVFFKLYSDSESFHSEPIFIKNKKDDSPGIKAYKYLSTFKLSPTILTPHSSFDQ